MRGRRFGKEINPLFLFVKKNITLFSIVALCANIGILNAARVQVPAASVSNAVAFHRVDAFAGWPANEGSWVWGDEALVGFEVGGYEPHDDTHSIDRSKAYLSFARTTDGGRTWVTEEHPELRPPVYLEDPKQFAKSPEEKDATIVPCSGIGDMTAPGFAMKLRGDVFYTTQDKGKTWSAPHPIPTFKEQNAVPAARTSYLVTGPQSAWFFVSSIGDRDPSLPKTAERGRAFVMKTEDGCKSFQFVGWMTPDLTAKASPKELESPVFSLMPSVVLMDDGHLVAALRQRIDRRKWTDIYESRDGGKTWTFLSEAERGSNNPPALVRLKDGRLAVIYGWRGKQPGMRAKISADGGKTWPDEYVIRADARTWDIGYPRAHTLDDGAVLIFYYYTTDANKQQHIAATRWTPPTAITQK